MSKNIRTSLHVLESPLRLDEASTFGADLLCQLVVSILAVEIASEVCHDVVDALRCQPRAQSARRTHSE